MTLSLSDTRLRRAVAIVLAAIICLGLIYLIVIAHLGSYSRYLADDFCTAGEVARMGFWPAQQFRYETWSGRFAFTFTVAGTHLLGSAFTPYLPAIAVILWSIAAVYLFYQLSLSLINVRTRLIPLAMTSILLSVVLASTPSIYQSLYWQTGMLTYIFPLVLSTGYLGWLIEIARKEATALPGIAILPLSFLWALFMGGFSETFVSVQIAALFLFVAIAWSGLFHRSLLRLRKVLLAGFLGSLAALALLVTAPGNAVRQSVMPPPPDGLTLFRATLNDWYIFSVRTLKWHPTTIVLSFLLPFLVGIGLYLLNESRRPDAFAFDRRFFLWFTGIPVLTFLLMLASIAPYEYALSSFPDARVLVTTLFICILGIAGWNFLVGLWLASRFFRARTLALATWMLLSLIGLGLLGIFTVQATRLALEDRDTMVRYAAAWDERDRQLRAQEDIGGKPIAAASLTHMGGLAEIGYDPDEWINRCVASTYGLESVIAK